MGIEWDRLTHHQFNEIVEALAYHMYADADRVRPYDGRGGDGGRDIEIIQDRRLHIWQIKFFPDGFPGSTKGRRSQIRRSFAAAMKHRPFAWVLVVPCELTPNELRFVEQLTNGSDVKISVMSRAELNSRLAAFPDLAAYFTREPLKDLAVILSQEKAHLIGGARDLGERVRRLGEVVDGCDPHWTYDFRREGDEVVNVLRAKHPRAQDASPISMHMTTSFGPEHANLASAVERVVGFGAVEEVVFPPETVAKLEVRGPEWLSTTMTWAHVIWQPQRSLPKPGSMVEIRLLDDGGNIVTACCGPMLHSNAGDKGFSLEARFLEQLDLRCLFPFDSNAASTVNCNFQLDGADPFTVLRVIRLYRGIAQCPQLSIYVDGRNIGAFRRDMNQVLPTEAKREALSRLESLVDDLDIVQRHCNVYFPVPDGISAFDRVCLRVGRLLIEGHCVASPEIPSVVVTLNGRDDTTLRGVLNGSPQSMRIGPVDTTLELGSHELHIGEVEVLHPQAIVENHEDALAHLDAGMAEGFQVRLRPARDKYFMVRMQDRSSDGYLPLRPTPWGLTGVEEPVRPPQQLT